MPTSDEASLVASDIWKSYGPLTALAGATLELRRGEVLGLVGDNGAGKSTMIKILAGAVIPDSGRITYMGRQVRFESPGDARAAGIETVYQDLSLCDHLSVAKNLFLGRELRHRRTPFLDEGEMVRQAQNHLKSLGITSVDCRALVRNMSGGQRQAVAVAKAATFSPRVLILDEPTAALGVKEVRMVLELIRTIRHREVSTILITHRLQDVFEVCDRILVMREGRDTVILDPKKSSLPELVYAIDGSAEVPERDRGTTGMTLTSGLRPLVP